jgi:ATP-binding cassette subfamily C protein LapB
MSRSGTAASPEWELPDDVSFHDDPLLGCLLLLGKFEHRHCTADSLTAGLPLSGQKLSVATFIRAARRIDLSARLVRRPLDQVPALVLPAVLLLRGERACILEHVDASGMARIILPESGAGTRTLPLTGLEADYSGYAIFIQRQHRFDERTSDLQIAETGHWFRDTILGAVPLYAEVLVAALLINLFALASPLFIMNVYDRVVPNRAIETLWVLATGIAIVYLFDLAMRSLRGYFLDIAGKRADILLSAKVFERMLGTRMAARPKSVGACANSLHEFDAFREFFTSITLTALVDLPFVFLFVFTIWLVGGSLAVVPLAVMPLSLLLAYVVHRALASRVAELQRHSAQKQATLIETLTGIETIKSLGAESAAQQRWEQLTGTIAQLGLKTRFLSNSAVNLTLFLQQMASVVVVVYGVYLISDGVLSMGGLIASTILTGRALAPLAQLAGTLTRFNQARAAYLSTDAMMHLPVERPADKQFLDRPLIKGDIEFRDVCFNYPEQDIAALDRVSFRVKAGEHVAIIGRIGSGKSTIERLVLGLYEPASGSILIDGTDSRQLDPADLRRNIGYVPQDSFLFYGSVRDNIIAGMPYAEDAAVLAASAIAGVADFVDAHPSGYDLQVGERGERLSGGQRQAVAVARALLRDPPVIVMDEPSNAMDNTTEEQFKGRLSRWSAGKTLLLVTHRASLLSLVDRIIVMDGGRIIADGPKDRVLEALRLGHIKVPKP